MPTKDIIIKLKTPLFKKFSLLISPYKGLDDPFTHGRAHFFGVKKSLLIPISLPYEPCSQNIAKL